MDLIDQQLRIIIPFYSDQKSTNSLYELVDYYASFTLLWCRKYTLSYFWRFTKLLEGRIDKGSAHSFSRDLNVDQELFPGKKSDGGRRFLTSGSRFVPEYFLEKDQTTLGAL